MKKIVLIAIMALIFYMTGCSNAELANDPIMSESPTPTLSNQPNIDAVLEIIPSGDWLDTKYYLEADKYSFSEVECAYYYHDGQKDEVDVDDPRLTRLLNLIVKSREDGTHAYQTGYIEKAEIQQCYGTSDTMVEVVFKKPYQNNIRGLLICKDSYLKLLDTESGHYPVVKNGELLAEMYWPYEALAQKAISEGKIQEIDRKEFATWGGEKWFDIVAYCGFGT